jgi:hypothetical protein
VDGASGAVWTQHGQPRIVFTFTIGGGKVAAIDLLADPERLRGLDLLILAAPRRGQPRAAPAWDRTARPTPPAWRIR